MDSHPTNDEIRALARADREAEHERHERLRATFADFPECESLLIQCLENGIDIDTAEALLVTRLKSQPSPVEQRYEHWQPYDPFSGGRHG